MPAARDAAFIRVVVVEDDRFFRAALATCCRGLGMQVLAEMPDGQAALDHLGDDGEPHPDLILTDCQMPRLDGIAMVRRLRARGDRTPVIMLSGHHDRGVADLALAAGVNCFIPKPLSTATLQEAVQQTLPSRAA